MISDLFTQVSIDKLSNAISCLLIDERTQALKVIYSLDRETKQRLKDELAWTHGDRFIDISDYELLTALAITLGNMREQPIRSLVEQLDSWVAAFWREDPMASRS